MNFAQMLAAFRAGTLDGPGLEQFRVALMQRIGAPEQGDNLPDLITVAGELSERITALNTQNAQVGADAAAAQAARDALAGVSVQTRNTQQVNGGQQAGGGTTQVLDRDQRQGDDQEPQNRGDVPELVQLGRAFTQSDAFRTGAPLLRSGGSGTISQNIETRALFATSNYPSNFTRVPGLVIQNDQPLTVLDLIDRRPISTNSVEWVQEVTAPSGAVEVTEGSVKAESTLSLQLVTDTAATIAHFVNITRQTLDDETQLRGYIEGRLTFGLLKRLNGQVLNGNGTAPNLRGILQQAGIGTYTAGTATEAAIISVRKAKTVAQLSEYDPDAVVMNPVDWEAIELSTDTQGTFRVSPNVQQGAPGVIWGLRVVVTTAITGTVFGTTGGTFLVGAFKEGATLWERTQVQLFITDSHASNFTSNILTLLAELRAALSVWRPKAFVKGTFGASRT
jgi:HK97 family phage major capsid protein